MRTAATGHYRRQEPCHTGRWRRSNDRVVFLRARSDDGVSWCVHPETGTDRHDSGTAHTVPGTEGAWFRPWQAGIGGYPEVVPRATHASRKPESGAGQGGQGEEPMRKPATALHLYRTPAWLVFNPAKRTNRRAFRAASGRRFPGDKSQGIAGESFKKLPLVTFLRHAKSLGVMVA